MFSFALIESLVDTCMSVESVENWLFEIEVAETQ